jgi:hypothetical protein
MSTNTALRAEIERALVASLHPSVNVYRYPPDSIQSPAVILGGIDWQHNQMVAGRIVTVPLYLAVTRRNTNYLADLDDLTDPDGGVVAAFDTPPQDTDFDSWNVTQVGSYRDINIGDVDYYAATVTVEVFC